MQPPWRVLVISDIVRDGLGLELLDTADVAEVFRCDADHTVTIRIFDGCGSFRTTVQTESPKTEIRTGRGTAASLRRRFKRAAPIFDPSVWDVVIRELIEHARSSLVALEDGVCSRNGNFSTLRN